MKQCFAKSVQRAIGLLSTSQNSKGYLLVKVPHAANKCCCFDCQPDIWSEVNKYLAQHGYGHIKDEGNLLIKKDGGEIVLECHESGMELLIPIVLSFPFSVLAGIVANLISKFIEKPSFDIIMVVLLDKNGNVKRENKIQPSDKILEEDTINDMIQKYIKTIKTNK